MKLKRFEEMECWKEARLLVSEVYALINNSEKLKKDFRLRDQISSAVVSIMSNIAEGFSRQTDKEFNQFLYISKSSAAEFQSLCYILLDLGYIDQQMFDKFYIQADRICRMISKLISYLSSTR